MSLFRDMVPRDQVQVSAAYLPPTKRQSQLNLAGGMLLLLGSAIALSFASKPLPRISGFIPAFDAIVCVTDLITASLLLAQFSITRFAAIWALAFGYLFSAAIVAAHALTFPGVFLPTTLVSTSNHINFRVYLIWHFGLPVAAVAYVWLRSRGITLARAFGPAALAAISGGAIMVSAAACIAWLAISPTVDPVSGRWLTGTTMLLCIGALSVLWWFQRSVLDEWLMVVILAMVIELAITGLVGGRVHTDYPYDTTTVGFYTGRFFSLVTSTAVLIALLAETSRLYAGTAIATTLASAVKVSQDLSSEIELPALFRRVITAVMENAGASRGLLILPAQSDYRIEIEALADRDGIVVRSNGSQDPALPETIIRHVSATQKAVNLDDATVPNRFSADSYLRARHPRSVLCLPLARQGSLDGLLYLENTRASHVFAPERTRLLELLAAQAAISLQNGDLYAHLQLQVGILQRLPVSAWTLKPDGTPDFVNHVWLEFTGQDLDFVRSHPEAWMNAVHPQDRMVAVKQFWEGVHSGRGFAIETRNLRARDGTYRWHLQQARALKDAGGNVLKFVGTTTDIDDQKRAEEALRQAQGDLARINRVTTMGELAASLAHELSQPISGVTTNADTCLRKLGRDSPDLNEVRTVVTRIARDAQRASEIIRTIRSQFKKDALQREAVDINKINLETIALLRDETVRYDISVRTELAADIPRVLGDRVQLQQVAMNLIVNSIEAMKDVRGIRELYIKSEQPRRDQILVSISDTGVGFAPELAERIFDPLFTTKAHGTGMGLRICRSIVEAHGGRMWTVSPCERGASFQFTLPAAIDGPAGAKSEGDYDG